MSWAIGYDNRRKRDIGYGVPAWCDHPDCKEEIDRGLAHVCGGEPYGGEDGCGLYFCADHRRFDDCNVCERCSQQKPPFTPKSDHPDWIKHKLADDSNGATKIPMQLASLKNFSLTQCWNSDSL